MRVALGIACRAKRERRFASEATTPGQHAPAASAIRAPVPLGCGRARFGGSAGRFRPSSPALLEVAEEELADVGRLDVSGRGFGTDAEVEQQVALDGKA